MATIFPRVIVKLKTTRGRPPGAHMAPAAPFTIAGCAAWARPTSCPATAGAPRTSFAAPKCTAAGSARSTTSGSSSASSASKSPLRAAARKASTTARWREAPYFSEAERAALAFAEAVTRLSDRADPVPDAIWDEAARHYAEPALAALILSIATTNVFNRLNVTTKQVAGAWG